jgi:CRP-like cAMP-binding protein
MVSNGSIAANATDEGYAYIGVKAESGWWRLNIAKNHSHVQQRPPDMAAKDRAMFQRCMHAEACIGANKKQMNRDLSLMFPLPPSQRKVFHSEEQCNWELGYAPIDACTDEIDRPSRCRLCATCRQGHKRAMGSPKCKACPPQVLHNITLALATLAVLVLVTVLIFMTIQDNLRPGTDVSEMVKKITLNYLQLTSLAGAIHLRWPDAIVSMFEAFEVVGSVGGHVLMPDCGFTHLKAATIFYQKQLFFAFMIPIICVSCMLVWSSVWVFVKTTHKMCANTMTGPKIKTKPSLTAKSALNYTILTAVMLVFLAYPVVTRFSISMLKCHRIFGETLGEEYDAHFLYADLQEPCFVGRHLHYVIACTIPQIIIYTISIPVGVFVLLWSYDKREETLSVQQRRSFKLRYGLLWLGYRRHRRWWESVIAFRKVCIIAIGSLIDNSVEIQALLASLLVFLAIVAHIIGQPFESIDDDKDARILNRLEFASLFTCWCTLWAGFLFYLGEKDSSTVSPAAVDTLKIVVISCNTLFLIFLLFIFAGAKNNDRKKKRATALSLAGLTLDGSGALSLTQVVPKDHAAFVDIAVDEDKLKRQSSTIRKVHDIHKEHSLHEAGFKAKTEKAQKVAKRKTMKRVQMRAELRRSKALRKVPAFAGLEDEHLEEIIKAMVPEKHANAEDIVVQGEVADQFFVVLKGECAAWQTTRTSAEGGEEERMLGVIGPLGFFGESMMLGKINGRRSATVRVMSDSAHLMVLKRDAWREFYDKHGAKMSSVLDELWSTGEARRLQNEATLAVSASAKIIDEEENLEEAPRPPPPPPPRGNISMIENV